MFDPLCSISDTLEYNNMVNFRLVSKVWNRVFVEYWVSNYTLIVHDKHISYVPEYINRTTLILKDCSISRDILFKLPKYTTFYKCSIHFPLLNKMEDIEKVIYHVEHDYSEYEFKICNCDIEEFCSKDYCNSLDYWLPEYKSCYIPNREELKEIMDREHSSMNLFSARKFTEFLEEKNNYSNRTFYISLFMLRNLSNGSGWCRSFLSGILMGMKGEFYRLTSEHRIYFKNLLEVCGDL